MYYFSVENFYLASLVCLSGILHGYHFLLYCGVEMIWLTCLKFETQSWVQFWIVHIYLLFCRIICGTIENSCKHLSLPYSCSIFFIIFCSFLLFSVFDRLALLIFFFLAYHLYLSRSVHRHENCPPISLLYLVSE